MKGCFKDKCLRHCERRVWFGQQPKHSSLTRFKLLLCCEIFVYEAHPVYNNTKLASMPHRARMHSLARLNTATWQGMIMQLTCPTKCCEAWYLCVHSPSRVRPSARAQSRRRRTPRRARPVGGCDEPADRPGRRPNTTPWLGRGCCYPGCKYILFIGCHIMTV